MKREIIVTSDGSHSIFVPELDEHYHSVHGAIQEAKHVFLKMGLHEFVQHKKEISILEIGLGTGLNAFLTYLDVQGLDVQIRYTGMEAFPVDAEMAKSLNYVQELTGKTSHDIFDLIHSCNWEEEVSLSKQFAILKKECTLEAFQATENYDLIYFDAFGPRVQPDMWSPKYFQKLYDSLNSGGILVTYCAKGQVRRDLQSVGFEVERLPGPPGKREMLRGRKD